MRRFILGLVVVLLGSSANAESSLPPCPGNFNETNTFKWSSNRGSGPFSADMYDDGITWTNCVGTALFPNGYTYVGEWKYGVQNGRGTLTELNGYQYIGGWRNGRFHGLGTEILADGKTKHGEWRDGRYLEQSSNEENFLSEVDMEGIGELFGSIILVLLVLIAYFLPTVVAYYRKHGYVGVIFALNLFGGVTGVLWLVAFAWACFPQEKSIADPFLGNVTGTGVRNVGDTVGSAGYGVFRGFNSEKVDSNDLESAAGSSMTSELKEAAELHSKGVLSDEEFQALKARILK